MYFFHHSLWIFYERLRFAKPPKGHDALKQAKVWLLRHSKCRRDSPEAEIFRETLEISLRVRHSEGESMRKIQSLPESNNNRRRSLPNIYLDIRRGYWNIGTWGGKMFRGKSYYLIGVTFMAFLSFPQLNMNSFIWELKSRCRMQESESNYFVYATQGKSNHERRLWIKFPFVPSARCGEECVELTFSKGNS